ncbi:tetratricopeptide repeat protein [Phragmitibacter flavus]|nr:tetratricopeptide repeat protein [Phragmitibacter flavus]
MLRSPASIPPIIAVLCLGFASIGSLSAQQPAPDPTQLTANELLSAARGAYDAGDWPQAESLFQSFIDTYGGTPEAADTSRKMKPLLVISKLRQKKYADTLELLEETLKDPVLDPVSADELAFWRGICHLQTEAHDPALAAFNEFHSGKLPYVISLPPAHRSIHNGRRVEAIILHAVCLILKEDHPAAAQFLGEQIPNLRQLNREAAGRATVLRLHSLLASNDDNTALQLVKETFTRLEEISQIVAFQTLSLQLGAKLLEQERFYDSIACLQRIWPKKRLLAHQQTSLANFKTRLAQVQKNPAQEYLAFQYDGLITRIEREIKNFESIPNFDSALRLRVATAYQGLYRYREAALILDDMLQNMPVDDIVIAASLNLIQCWLQVERWPNAIAAADTYLEKFNTPENQANIPTVHFLRATAFHSDRQPYEAELAFTTVHNKFPDHELAPRALFMEGITLLEQDLNLEAIDAFNETARRYPDSDIIEDTHYWTGMALSFDKQHEKARQHMQEHLARYTDHPRYRPDAKFRIAHATFALADYPLAITELRQFIDEHRGTQFAEEAKLLLGDALGSEGKIDEAIAAYLTIDRDANPKFFEDAQFRVGNIYKLAERFDTLRDHFQTFIADHPKSQRIGEAVYWIGWTHDTSGDRDLARQTYWKTIDQYGPNPEITGIESILTALTKLYPGEDGREQLSKELEALIANSTDSNPTLTLRATWAKANLVQKTDPDAAQKLLISLRPTLDPKIHAPLISADIADALRQANQLDPARELYTDLRKWHPRALEKDRAYFGLGMIALTQKQPDEALKHFQRFEKETLGSSLLAQVYQIKAQLHRDKNRYAEAQAEYEKVLEMPTAPRQIKAQTLLNLGELLVQSKNDLKATAYFERVYLSYGRYLPEVASAYWQRAQALDRLNQPDKALEVYLELAQRPDLVAQSQQQDAIQLLNQRNPQWRFQNNAPVQETKLEK